MRLNTGRDSKRKINTECIIGVGAVLIHIYSGVIIPKNVTASRNTKLHKSTSRDFAYV